MISFMRVYDSLQAEDNLTYNGTQLQVNQCRVTGSLRGNYSAITNLSGNITLSRTTHLSKLLFFTGAANITVPNNVFTAGEVIAIYNNSTSSLTLTQGASVVLRWAGTTVTGSRTLNPQALVNIICTSGTSPDEFILSGTGIT